MLVEISDDMMASTLANIVLAEAKNDYSGYNYLTADETAAIEHISQQCRAKLDQRNRGSDNSVVVTVSNDQIRDILYRFIGPHWDEEKDLATGRIAGMRAALIEAGIGGQT